MKFYCFAPTAVQQRLENQYGSLRAIVERVAAGTDTGDLVVVLYLLPISRWYGGTAYTRQWLQPGQFFARRGKWRLVSPLAEPDDLPVKFKLIRLALPAGNALYPRTETDIYGWRHTYASFAGHLAWLFAHELHHFRRYHLGYHAGEGEQAANHWAMVRTRACRFDVTSQKLAVKKKRRHTACRPTILQLLNPIDFPGIWSGRGTGGWSNVLLQSVAALPNGWKKKYIDGKLAHIERLRLLQPGDSVWIVYDPSRCYQQQCACVVRPLRRNSIRLVIRTKDGRDWRWPIVWLSEKEPV